MLIIIIIIINDNTFLRLQSSTITSLHISDLPHCISKQISRNKKQPNYSFTQCLAPCLDDRKGIKHTATCNERTAVQL